MSQAVLNYEVPRRLPRPRIATILLITVLLLTLLVFLAMGVSGGLSAHLWGLYAAGRGLNPAEIALTDTLHELGDFSIPAAMVTFIFLLVWMVDAHRNLRTLTPQRMRFSKVDVLTGWILSRSSVIRPFEVMKEMYALSHGRQRDAFMPLCGCWWGFWLAANLTALLGFLAVSRTDLRGADAQIYYAIWTVFCAVPYVISGTCLAALVYRTDRAQARRRSAIESVPSLCGPS